MNERIVKALKNLGLSETDVQVYVFLSKKGPQKVREISKALGIYRQQLYLSLKSLQSKGIVSATFEHPANFSAIPFEKVLDMFVKSKLEEAKKIQVEKDELITNWQTLQIGEKRDNVAKFMVIEGRSIIYARIRQMIGETSNSLSIISSVPGLVRADQFGLIDDSFNVAIKDKIKVWFLTHLSKKDAHLIKPLLERVNQLTPYFEGRNPDFE